MEARRRWCYMRLRSFIGRFQLLMRTAAVCLCLLRLSVCTCGGPGSKASNLQWLPWVCCALFIFNAHQPAIRVALFSPHRRTPRHRRGAAPDRLTRGPGRPAPVSHLECCARHPGSAEHSTCGARSNCTFFYFRRKLTNQLLTNVLKVRKRAFSGTTVFQAGKGRAPSSGPPRRAPQRAPQRALAGRQY